MLTFGLIIAVTMHLQLIVDPNQAKVRIFALVEDGICKVLHILNNGLNNQSKGSCHGILHKLTTISEKGLSCYSSKILHEASKKEKIYEIVHGDLRLFYFVEKNNMVCTHIMKKKGQKASPADINYAVSIRNKIDLSVKKDELIILKEDEKYDTLQIATENY